MTIAVCEDYREEALWLCEMIQKWAVKNGVGVDVVSFDNASAFLFAMEEDVYDALFLDIKMPGEDGITLAKRLRSSDNRIPIVFVTGEKDYIMEGYEVEAVNYLLKPVEEVKLFASLNRIYDRTKKQEPYIILHTEDAVVKLLQKDIYKVEVYAHNVVYTTAKGQYELTASLKEVQKELQDRYFVSCYRGVLVNLQYVDSIKKSSLILADGKTGFRMEIPVSRRLYNKVNEAFIQYYKKQGENSI